MRETEIIKTNSNQPTVSMYRMARRKHRDFRIVEDFLDMCLWVHMCTHTKHHKTK